jgi:ribonuclease BN (tRNA processing enzyme)
LINFFKPCDLLIHEAQYTPMQYSRHIGWGHSSITNASILAKLCKPEKWYVTHHDPEATDENLMNRLLIHKEVLEESQIPVEVHLAYDYLTLPL